MARDRVWRNIGPSKLVGAVLLAVSTISLVQTVRALGPLLSHRWTQTHIDMRAFTFAGRAIEINGPPKAASGGGAETIALERITVDGKVIGTATGHRMATWRTRDDGRSQAWLETVVIEDRKARDSSLWIARRLQQSDAEPPRIEIITVDAAGQISVKMHSANDVGGEYQLRAATAMITDRPEPRFPLAATWFVWSPICGWSTRSEPEYWGSY